MKTPISYADFMARLKVVERKVGVKTNGAFMTEKINSLGITAATERIIPPYTVIVHPAFTLIPWTQRELEAMLAHEVSHLALGHISVTREEFDARTPADIQAIETEADDNVVKLGYGLDLIAAFHRMDEYYHDSRPDIPASERTHPAPSSRITRIQSQLKGLSA